ncbi:hypothetical protein DL769_000613 [Monosporascus sp. CRB-8-3]|nr:hypothetical protein DL769_000613 [Monosporascus sp. CRB-8-3]
MPPVRAPSSEPPHSDLEVYRQPDLEVNNGSHVLIGNDKPYQDGGGYSPQYQAEAQAKASPNKTRRGWVVPAIIGALISAVVQCPTRHCPNEYITLNEHYFRADDNEYITLNKHNFRADDNDWGTDRQLPARADLRRVQFERRLRIAG